MSIVEKKNKNNPESPAVKMRKLQELATLKQARSRMMVCFYTFPLYAVALVLLLNDGRRITTFMFVYMGIYAVFGINMIIRKCPECREQFFVKSFLLNLFTKKCVHCGLHLHQQNEDSGSNNERAF